MCCSFMRCLMCLFGFLLFVPPGTHFGPPVIKFYATRGLGQSLIGVKWTLRHVDPNRDVVPKQQLTLPLSHVTEKDSA